MTNAELIKALRKCGKQSPDRCWDCEYYDREPWCESALANDAADALEADEQRIAELEARLPKEGEWISDALGVQVDEFGIAYTIYAPRCSECGLHFDAISNYCPNCGARMQTVTDCHTLEEGEHDEQADC